MRDLRELGALFTSCETDMGFVRGFLWGVSIDASVVFISGIFSHGLFSALGPLLIYRRWAWTGTVHGVYII